jgi:hypothetical protein
MKNPDWSKQSQRLWEFLLAYPNREHPAPTLNSIAAGNGLYVASFSKRVSEVRERARAMGYDFLKTKDERDSTGQRHTGYTFYMP